MLTIDSADNENPQAALSQIFGPWTGTFANPKSDDLTVRVVGDTNGDGLDDVMLVNRRFVTSGSGSPAYPGLDCGTCVLAAMSNGQLRNSPRPAAATRIYTDYFLDAAHALGDVNRDGYADFALTRSQEGASLATGSVFVHYGTPAVSQTNAGELFPRRLQRHDHRGTMRAGRPPDQPPIPPTRTGFVIARMLMSRWKPLLVWHRGARQLQRDHQSEQRQPDQPIEKFVRCRTE